MRKLGLHEIRKEYLDFFEEKAHLVVPSYSLIPKDDDSLLLVGAGMAPLKKYFTGEAKPPKNRMASCQKCIRTGDIENVGKTDRHATFFEMLGNFSFGDYFKIESMEWAWEFMTERMEVPKEDIWVTVYKDDDEAHDLWRDEIGIPEEKIVRLGKEDNFWELEVGPSGPCSEIFIDRGEKYGCGEKTCKPGCECDRFIEVWNLVFTQYDKDKEGNYNELAHPNIDTGMGLERMATVSQGVDNIFEIEEIQGIINVIEELADYKYGEDDKKDESIRVITDHARAMTFLVSDGVLPSNEGRGYVLRRLIRRAARRGKLLGIEGEFLSTVVEEVIESWKVEYKELEENKETIIEAIIQEEERFQKTIDSGIERLDSYISSLLDDNLKELSGRKAFMLYDTYGFPLDLTKEILEEKGLGLDEEGFHKNMEEQRRRAREARKDENVGWSASEDETIFEGLDSSFDYHHLKLETRVSKVFKDSESVEELIAGDKGIIVLEETPFYGESGGQVGDTGFIENDNFKAKVLDTQHTKNDLTIHIVELLEGKVTPKEEVVGKVNYDRRRAIIKNHSATHLLNQALRDVLGDHVLQAGSIVDENRLRFDFTHPDRLSYKEISEIEEIVNEKIARDIPVEVEETSLEKAREEGVMGIFDDKYDDEVRVVRMGDYSEELCGGTHVKNTSEIGMFKIISEASVSAGTRRIEAITGYEVYKYMKELDNKVNKVGKLLKTDINDLIDRVESIVAENRDKDKEIQDLRSQLAEDISTDIINSAVDVDDIKLVTYNVGPMDMENMRNLGDELRDKLGSSVIVLASTLNDRLTFLCMTTKDLNKRGIHAGNIIREVAQKTNGNGGGRPDMAQAGGKDIEKLDEAFAIVPELIKESLE